MAKVDLHNHSKYSDRPSEWFLQKIGASECYSEPDFLYTEAKRRGMDFATVTDHNKIDACLLLKEKYPDKVFTGVEVTTYFPENNCKVHILVYGLIEEDFETIQSIRKNIYELRLFIKESGLAYSVAHPTYSINNRLNVELLEKLILMFDVFEVINGARSRLHNVTLFKALKSLTPNKIDKLYEKYKIEPISSDPWKKGYTGGSDDHAGIFIGKTYTYAKADTPEEFLEKLKDKYSLACGRHNDYKSLTFTFYKIAYEFSKHNSSRIPKSIMSEITESIFENKSLSLINLAKISIPKSLSKKNGSMANEALIDILETFKKNGKIRIEDKFDILYDKITVIADDLMKMFFSTFEKDITKGDIFNLVKNISSALPAFFLSAPFFSTFFHLYRGRELIKHLEANYLGEISDKKRKILWFTDTLADINGVSDTLKNIGWLAKEKHLDITLATSLCEDENKEGLPPNVMDIKHIHEFNLPYYEQFKMKIPSILDAIKIIDEYEPDMIYISTPGPVGMLGLLASKLLDIKCIGVYHIDFMGPADEIIGNEGLSVFLRSAEKWLYSSFDEVLVPDKEYFDLLCERGISNSKLKMFKQGVSLNDQLLNENGKHFNINEAVRRIISKNPDETKNVTDKFDSVNAV